MKTNRLGIILLAAVVSTLLMFSCKKKSEDPQPGDTTETPVIANGTFTAKINGTAKAFGTNFYVVSGGVGTTITGTETGGTGITLAFFSTTTGTYDVDGTLTQAYYNVGSTQHTPTGGKIIITKVDNNKISGTFYFEETGGVKVTDGVFTDVPKK